ncbi:surface lipoprotein assembly modifier [Conchiformibius kuhniae]|uniref:Surface lipoprotein assembly modifier n=1 Tax=Conchiformibius kuhniae TaxID=211502 RepID=A0A8T9MYZ6_9NEIS|nr:surface lipoprotein assembly modifier [Conchiformibius kuhniae]UOP05412.1 surface lipoprotein assembly modifier [Conchiformibius kuhniae]
MIYKFSAIVGVLLLLSAQVLANGTVSDEQIRERLNDSRIQDESRPEAAPPAAAPEKPSAAPAADEGKTLELSKEQLLEHPDLLVRALMAALLQNNPEHVAMLYPIYRRLPDNAREQVLEDWGAAVSARHQGRYGEAVRRYRAVLSAQPDLLLARLQLATALFEDKQFEAAEDQFRRLRSETSLPDHLHAHIDQYLAALRRGSPWRFGGGMTYQSDKNINNAPKNPDLGNGFRSDPPEAANGIALSLNAGKKFVRGNGLFGEVRADANGKYYWNNKKYNDFSVRTAAGAGYQNARSSVALLPFFEHTWYAGATKQSNKLQRFSRSAGITLEASHRFSPKWQSNFVVEYGRQRYRTRPHLNGRSLFGSATVSYLPNARQYWFAGIDHNRSRARDLDDSSNRTGVRVGWGQEWGQGFSSRLTLSHARKNHLGINFFGSRQQNREWGVNTSLWHRKLHWKGVTPRLTWHYHRQRSNQVFYSYSKHRVFVELGKQF